MNVDSDRRWLLTATDDQFIDMYNLLAVDGLVLNFGTTTAIVRYVNSDRWIYATTE